jgi:ABC-2 type transport system permease protein
MRNFRTLFRRELATLYYTPTSYVVMCVFLIVVGWLFWILVNYLNAPSKPIDANVFGYLFGGTFIYWMVVAAVTSALTMRSFSEEYRSGTIEMLMTTPVTDTQVVLSKFAAAQAFLMIMWVPTLVYVYVLSRFTTVDYGVVAAGYLGTFLLNCMLTSLGIMISSTNRSQFVSFFVTFIGILMLFSLNFMQDVVSNRWRVVYRYASVLEQFNPFTKGVISSQSVVYFVSITLFLLFCTIKSVESRKWR